MQLLLLFIRPLIAHARVPRGVVDVGCPAQFNISANVQRWMWLAKSRDGDRDNDDGAIRARSKLASS